MTKGVEKVRDFRDRERTIYGNDRVKNAARFVTNYVSTAKYTVWSFVPKNLFEQFLKLANFYFLIISSLQQIPDISPTGKYTTAMPLGLVLLVTAIKEAYEDIQRHKQDKEVNFRYCQVLRTVTQAEIDGGMLGDTSVKGWYDTLWQDIQVGDIVRVKNKEPFPADLLLLSSSGPQGICYIETSQLDGETNLKIRQSLASTTKYTTPETFREFDGTLNCEGPNEFLYSFTGTLTQSAEQYPIETKHILLRGAVLRNTQWITGMVVYSGHETKQMMNANDAPIKRTLVERTTNSQVVYVFMFLCLLALACAIGSSFWMSENSEKTWYLQFDGSVAASTFWNFLTFIILFNNLIPISLYVTIEMVKFAQARLINADMHMYYEEKDTPANARTSNLNEELGQVEYIFSDKTGTLTRNMMEFRKVCVNGTSYGYGTTEIGIAAKKRAGTYQEGMAEKEKDRARKLAKSKRKAEGTDDDDDDEDFIFDDPRLIAHLKDKAHPNSKLIDDMLTLLSVCHTVIPERDESHNNRIMYQASSPDENALVQAAKHLGYGFCSRTPEDIGVEIDGRGTQRYEMLNVLEFTSTRKRMSVIVRTPEGKIVLFCKGADTVIYPRIKLNSDEEKRILETTTQQLIEYANEGLRTLVCACREIDPTEYSEWAKIFKAASITIKNREEELAKAAEMMETNLTLVGATAIEDKLQEGVPDTIATLAEAGIKIWVLTGDKQETAINIGFACALLTDDMQLIILNDASPEGASKALKDKLAEVNANASVRTEPLAVIIDGATLTHALSDANKLVFLDLCKQCKAVICCRVSPAQKASVVTLAKKQLSAITLAIGDGANDVAMIQAAHVGIGISGEEGLQAARSADYSIAQFRFLKRLLLVHGRFSYRRVSKVILYSFYKNICLYMTQCWFTFLCGFSGQSLYEKWTLSLYNVAFASLPIVAFGILDQDVALGVAEEFPQLYVPGHKRLYFNFKVFWKWVMSALIHSLICFFVPILSFSTNVNNIDGKTDGLYAIGFTIYTVVILTVTLKAGLETSYWTKYNHLVIWGSIVFWFLYNIIYCLMWPVISFGPEVYMMIYRLFETPTYFLIVLIVPVAALLRDVTWKFFQRSYIPEPYHIIQEVCRERAITDIKKKDEIERQKKSAAFLTSQRRKNTGYAYVGDEANAERIGKIHREGTMVGLVTPRPDQKELNEVV